MAATLDTLMSQLPDGFASIMKQSQEAAQPEYEKGLKAEREYAKTRGELGVQKAELEARAARGAAGAQAAVYKKYEPELMAPPPTIQYNPDTVQGMQSLMVLLPIAGAMMGGGGQLSGIGALKAMSGVLEGHQQGNQDRIALESKNFEQQMQNWKLHMEQVKGAFERALQLAKINASAAQSGLKIELAKLDAKLLAADVERNGVTAPAQRNLAMIDKITSQIEQAQMKLISEKPIGYTVNGEYKLMTPMEAKTLQNAGFKVVEAPKPSSRGGLPLESSEKEQLAQSVANYSVDPKTLSYAERNQILARAKELNPDYNQGDYGNINLAYRQWISPNGTGAKNIAAFSTVAQHLEALDGYGEALNNNDLVAANKLKNYLSAEFGEEAVTNFSTARQAVAAEVVRAITGTGGALRDRQEAEQAFSVNASPKQIKGAIDVSRKLIGGRLNTARQQFKSGTKRDDAAFDALLPPEVQRVFGSGKLTDTGAPKPGNYIYNPETDSMELQ